MAVEAIGGAAVAAEAAAGRRSRHTDLAAIGEPALWPLGGALVLGIIMVAGFLALILWNGATTFLPKPIAVVTTTGGERVAGEPTRAEYFRPSPEVAARLAPGQRAAMAANDGLAGRTLYRIGNYDLYNEDFRWLPDFEVARVDYPADMLFVERLEWGPLVGSLKSLRLDGSEAAISSIADAALRRAHRAARQRWQRIREIERNEIGGVNYEIERERLALRRAVLRHEPGSDALVAAEARFAVREAELKRQYEALSGEARGLRAEDAKDQITFAEIGGRDKTIPLSAVVRMYAANDLGFWQRAGIYLSRWWEFLSEEPREANTEGGVLPAIFGTFAMTLLLVIVVAPFGVITALYLREYAKQGRLVSIVRISVNNLAGVPSIVYGVFGLGFFAYIVGGSIDQIFFAERLPNPTFGTGGLLWASLTLALLTVPVVIVATEEALAAVPRSMREGSLACGASRWQTIRNIVLPRAMPGIMTGIILAMARGAGEVAPLMLVGVVKLAPELPVDGYFPFIHLERSFMHLGFHIYDVGFQSRNSEAGKPMVFVTTLLLIALIAAMNAAAIVIRNRLRRRFAGSQF
jgi:phosphate transport system permease protein